MSGSLTTAPAAAVSYVNLITSEHAGRPKFVATVNALVTALTSAQAAIAGIPAAFDLDGAIGAQLDVDGRWIGRSRYLDTPLQGVYFSLDVAGLGFDQGVWYSPYDPAEGLIELADDAYRLLLRAKIVANSWDGTVTGMLPAFQDLLGSSGSVVSGIALGLEDGSGALALESSSIAIGLEAASATTNLFVEDRQDMSMVVGVSGLMPNALLQALLAGGYVPLRPMGVQLVYLATTVDGDALFGFDASNQYVAGFDTGAWGSPFVSSFSNVPELDVNFIVGVSTLG